MAHIAQDSLATLNFTFTWTSSHATHIERFLASDVSFTRDMLPLGVKSRMRGMGAGDAVTLDMDPSELPEYKPGMVMDMPLVRFTGPEVNGRRIKPRIGRFYPKHCIAEVPGTRPDSTSPFRVVDVSRSGFRADLNHPMAGREVTIRAEAAEVKPSPTNAGKLTRWSERFFDGPGMQARLPESPTDFLGADPFARQDEAGDADFYAAPRLVSHIDASARAAVQSLYADLLDDGMDVLDLMAGHQSHLPGGLVPSSVTGLGLNREELAANPALTADVIHNLNEAPTLPFDDASFDAVICALSVEYLVHPFEIVEEAARVLRPGGALCFSFSNRWFPPKVVRVWTELHEYERMGLVSQYILRPQLFTDLHTLSDRGRPRPSDPDDRYAGKLPHSDPVFGVWAFKA